LRKHKLRVLQTDITNVFDVPIIISVPILVQFNLEPAARPFSRNHCH